jgi:hypothetical protein
MKLFASLFECSKSVEVLLSHCIGLLPHLGTAYCLTIERLSMIKAKMTFIGREISQEVRS